MLGKYVRIKVTHPIHSYSNEQGFTYELNYGEVEGAKQFNASVKGAFIMGINHPVRSFDGRVVGIVRYDGSNETDWVVAPKSTRFINIDIANGIDFAVKNKKHTFVRSRCLQKHRRNDSLPADQEQTECPLGISERSRRTGRE